MRAAQAQSGPQPSLFASRVWLDRWLTAFGGESCGYWSEGETCIAYVLQTQRLGPLRLRVACAAANSHTPRFDSTGHAISAKELRRMIRELDVAALVLPYLSPSSRLLAGLSEAPKLWLTARHPCEEAPYIDCSGSWQQYLEKRGKTRSAGWHKYARRMEKSGASFEILDAPADIEGALPEALEVESSGWKGKRGSAMVQDKASRGFYEAICRDLANLGKLRLFLIRRHGRIIAFQLTSLDEGILTGLKTSYREEHAKESPGQVLQFWITRWAFAEPGLRRYDLLGPASEHKLRFATGIESLETFHVFAASVPGLVAWSRWGLAPRLKEWARRLLPRHAAKRLGEAERQVPAPASS